MKPYLFFLFFILISCANQKVLEQNEVVIISDTPEISSNEEKTFKKKKIIVSKELENEIKTIVVSYAGWGCPYPQWVTAKNKRRYERKKSNIHNFFYHIEPCNKSIASPFDLVKDINAYKYRLTGYYYKEKQYIHEEGEQAPARTFCYHKIEAIKK